jgi:hypothetical protein
MYRLGIEIQRLNKKSLKMLGKVSPVFDVLVDQMECLNDEIYKMDKVIAEEVEKDSLLR